MTERDWLESTDAHQMFEWLGKTVRQRWIIGNCKLRLCLAACCRRVWHLLPEEPSRNAVKVSEANANNNADGGELGNVTQSTSRNANCTPAAMAAHQLTEPYANLWLVAPSIVRNVVAAVVENIDFDKYPQYSTAADRQATANARLQTAYAAADEASFRAAHALHAARLENVKEANAEAAMARESLAEITSAIQIEVHKTESAALANILRCVFANPFQSVNLDRTFVTETVLAIARSISDSQQLDDMSVLGDALEDAGCTNDDILNHCRSAGEHVRGCWVVDLVLGRT